MALIANALITIPELIDYLGATTQSSEVLSLYQNGAGSSTAATVEVTSTEIVFVITGGTNAGTFTYTRTNANTITALAADATLNARGWKFRVIGSGETTLDMLEIRAATNALLNANEQFLAAINLTRLIQAVNFASQTIETFCSRSFATATYTHLYSGRSRDKLRLRHGPVQRVDRLSIGRKSAFTVTNNSIDAISSQVQITSADVRLDVIGGVNASESSVTYTGATTLTTTIAAINALGKGWTAVLDPAAGGSWLTVDCLDCDPKNALRSNATIFVPEQNVDEFSVNKEAAILTLQSGASRSSLLNMIPVLGAIRPPELRPLTAQFAGAFFPEGKYNIYVKYVAGFDVIPSDIKWGAAEIAANAYHASQRDTGLRSENIEGYAYDVASIFGAGRAQSISDQVKGRISRYRYYVVPEYEAA